MPEFSLRVVEGAEKTLAVMGGTYQPYFLDDLTRATRQFAQIGNVARHARLVRALRWRDGFQVDRLADLLESDFSA